jgi:hypothetical protein
MEDKQQEDRESIKQGQDHGGEKGQSDHHGQNTQRKDRQVQSSGRIRVRNGHP